MPEGLFAGGAGVRSDAYSGNRTKAGVASALIHGGAAALLLFIGSRVAENPPLPDPRGIRMAVHLPVWRPAAANRGGGGGGGQMPLPSSRGDLPRSAPRVFVPPTTQQMDQPKLAMPVAMESEIPGIEPTVIGNPVGVGVVTSDGPGKGPGLGDSRGRGIGPGEGPGFGPDRGPGTGHVYPIRQVSIAPVPVHKVEPEYSEDARKVKLQGSVLVSLVVDERGNVRDVRVVRPLGMGLDQKAVEAIGKWRFRPGIKDGKPVAVQATVEVNFRLL